MTERFDDDGFMLLTNILSDYIPWTYGGLVQFEPGFDGIGCNFGAFSLDLRETIGETQFKQDRTTNYHPLPGCFIRRERRGKHAIDQTVALPILAISLPAAL